MCSGSWNSGRGCKLLAHDQPTKSLDILQSWVRKEGGMLEGKLSRIASSSISGKEMGCAECMILSDRQQKLWQCCKFWLLTSSGGSLQPTSSLFGLPAACFHTVHNASQLGCCHCFRSCLGVSLWKPQLLLRLQKYRNELQIILGSVGRAHAEDDMQTGVQYEVWGPLIQKLPVAGG